MIFVFRQGEEIFMLWMCANCLQQFEVFSHEDFGVTDMKGLPGFIKEHKCSRTMLSKSVSY